MSDLGDSDGLKGDDALVAEYVLGLLPAAEHDAFARRISADSELRHAVATWRLRFQDLDAQYAETAAPSNTWSRIESRLFGGARPTASWWNSLTLWRGFTSAALAVAVVAVGFNVFRPAPLDPEQFAVQLVAALQSQEGSGVEFVAFYDSATSTVKLLGLSGQAAPNGDFELWYISGSDAPVSMGVVAVDQKKEIPLDAAARGKIGEGTVLAVTLEQKGGSPDGAPHGPVVSAGPALAI